MPSREAHIAAARENQRALEYLSERFDSFGGWVAVVAFYKALLYLSTTGMYTHGIG